MTHERVAVGMFSKKALKWPIAASALIAFIVGCTTTDPLADNDQRILSQLAEIASEGSRVSSEILTVKCWKPSDNMIDDSQFRVLCRIYYMQDSLERYRDMICVGNAAADPVTDYCYEWAYYSSMPRFEDQPGYVSSN